MEKINETFFYSVNLLVFTRGLSDFIIIFFNCKEFEIFRIKREQNLPRRMTKGDKFYGLGYEIRIFLAFDYKLEFPQSQN